MILTMNSHIVGTPVALCRVILFIYLCIHFFMSKRKKVIINIALGFCQA